MSRLGKRVLAVLVMLVALGVIQLRVPGWHVDHRIIQIVQKILAIVFVQHMEFSDNLAQWLSGFLKRLELVMEQDLKESCYQKELVFRSRLFLCFRRPDQ